MAYTRQGFIDKIAPMAQSDAKRSKVLASLTIAQAILESNNGNSALTREGNALFGIKATNWNGKRWTGKTIEYYSPNKPTTINAGFRAYDSWEESIADHSKLLSNARYKRVVGEKDYKKACELVAQCGYATDPSYAKKLISLIETHKLYQFDGEVEKYMVKKKKIKVNGVVKEVSVIEVDGSNFVKIRDLADKNIEVAYDTATKMPTISIK